MRGQKLIGLFVWALLVAGVYAIGYRHGLVKFRAELAVVKDEMTTLEARAGRLEESVQKAERIYQDTQDIADGAQQVYQEAQKALALSTQLHEATTRSLSAVNAHAARQ